MDKCEICNKKVIVDENGKNAGFCFYKSWELYLCKKHYQEWLKEHRKTKREYNKIKGVNINQILEWRCIEWIQEKLHQQEKK